MKQITAGKFNEKLEKALSKVLPTWIDYSYTMQTIGDIFFVDLSVETADRLGTIQVFMDINRFDARKAVRVEIA